MTCVRDPLPTENHDARCRRGLSTPVEICSGKVVGSCLLLRITVLETVSGFHASYGAAKVVRRRLADRIIAASSCRLPLSRDDLCCGIVRCQSGGEQA